MQSLSNPRWSRLGGQALWYKSAWCLWICFRKDQHVVRQSHLSLLVANDWESELRVGDLVNVFYPVAMFVHGVCAEPNELDSSFCKFRLQLCECAQLGSADWGKILWVGKQDDPFITCPT